MLPKETSNYNEDKLMSEKTMEMEKREELIPEMENRPQRLNIPRVDIQDAAEIAILMIDMPGVDERDVDITLEKNVLTVIGQVTDYAPDGFRNVHSEYRVYGYKRAFKLSDEIDRENIQATLINGVLRLTLNKAEEAKARKISLQVEA